jgi:predicted class III extradiol MEMO1 family dioxygenase
MEIIRPPAVAGMFYPVKPDVLRNMIEQDLALEACPRIENLLGNCSPRFYPRFGNLYPNPLTLFITGKLLVTRSSYL